MEGLNVTGSIVLILCGLFLFGNSKSIRIRIKKKNIKEKK